MARKPACCKARRSASRHAGLSVGNTILLIFVSLREGFFLLKKETDSKAINALLSVWIFCFPSVGHLLYGYFMCTDLKDASFFGSILSKYERKIVPKTVFRLNLYISDIVRTYLCTHLGMSVWWEYHTEVHLNVVPSFHQYALNYSHTGFHSYIRAYARSQIQWRFSDWL